MCGPPLQRDIFLEQGQVRIAQNSTNHQKHSEEIALGMAMGPISEKHRWRMCAIFLYHLCIVSIYLSIYLSINLSIHRSIYPTIYASCEVQPVHASE